MESVDLYETIKMGRNSLTYHFFSEALELIDPDFSIGLEVLQVELKINGKEIPIIQMLQAYEKVYDEIVAEEAAEIVERKMIRLTEILSGAVKCRAKKRKPLTIGE